MTTSNKIFGREDDWRQQLAEVIETMREMSEQTDPNAMVAAYGKRMREFVKFDRTLSLSRRDLARPQVRVTRNSDWKENPDPWRQRDRLPVVSGGILAELIYSDEARLVTDFVPDESDPAFEYLQGMRSFMAIPHFDGGHGVNMVVHLRRQPDGFDAGEFPQFVLISNLFGRATRNLAQAREISRAYDEVDRELRAVEEIQKSLLPASLPEVPGLQLAQYYQTSRRAGGDYYDFFPMPSVPQGNGKTTAGDPGHPWGILIADVSGHGTPAAVVMAITHAIAHETPGPPTPPGTMLTFINNRLATRYTGNTGAFVTAFYGIYDPAGRTLRYACAGHNPPRLWDSRARVVKPIDLAAKFPLGIEAEETFDEAVLPLAAGDVLLFYTDGIIETFNNSGQMFGYDRLDELLATHHDRSPAELVDTILREVTVFAGGRPAADDRTVVIARVT